jgi:hypothetical protein
MEAVSQQLESGTYLTRTAAQRTADVILGLNQ